MGITVLAVLTPRLLLAHDQGCSGPEGLAAVQPRSAFSGVLGDGQVRGRPLKPLFWPCPRFRED